VGALRSGLGRRHEVADDLRAVSAGEIVRSRRSAAPPVPLGVSLAVVVVLSTPVVFLVIQAHRAGFDAVMALVWRPLTAKLLWNTVSLTAAVTVLCAAIGTLTAWCVERTDVPARRFWAVMLVVPFAIPAFVVSWGWESLTTWAKGFHGAVLIMTLTLFPLVHLFVGASLRSADPGLEEAARGLGLGRVRTFVRVTLGQSRNAILSGCVVVALILLAEYGAFEDLGFQTFTMEIFREFQISFNVPTACAMSFVLLGLGVGVLGGDVLAQGTGRVVRSGQLAQRDVPRHRLGRATLPVLVGLIGLVGLAVGVPVGSSIYWFFEGGAHALAGGSILEDAIHTVLYSAAAAALAALAALPVALLAVRHGGRGVRLLVRSTFVILAMPGLVVALALSYFSEHYGHGLGYQSAPMLIVAYAMLFFPLALVGVQASAAYVPVGLEQAASALGQRRLPVFVRVTLPLVAPGLATGFCLVFIAAVTELTATLVLVPAGVQTLATQFWA